MATKPFEVIMGALFEVFAAPVGEAFPEVDTAPAGNWTKLGKNGAKNMSEAGLTVQHNQTIELHHVYGVAGPVKATRPQEGHIYTFELEDLLAEEYARVLNDNTVTTVAAAMGTPGHKDVNLSRGILTSEKAWLFRGDASPEGDTFSMQYEVPRGIVTSSPQVVYTKSGVAMLQFEVTTLFDNDEAAGEEMGRLIVQNAVAI